MQKTMGNRFFDKFHWQLMNGALPPIGGAEINILTHECHGEQDDPHELHTILVLPSLIYPINTYQKHYIRIF